MTFLCARDQHLEAEKKAKYISCLVVQEQRGNLLYQFGQQNLEGSY